MPVQQRLAQLFGGAVGGRSDSYVQIGDMDESRCTHAQRCSHRGMAVKRLLGDLFVTEASIRERGRPLPLGTGRATSVKPCQPTFSTVVLSNVRLGKRSMSRNSAERRCASRCA